MESLYVLIPLSLVLVFVIAAVFWWALQRNQFDHLDEAGRSILEDDDSGKHHPSSSVDTSAQHAANKK